MKKIVRWFAEITGVASTIRKEERTDIGHELAAHSAWFSKDVRTCNAIFLYGYYLQQNKIASAGTIREVLDKWQVPLSSDVSEEAKSLLRIITM